MLKSCDETRLKKLSKIKNIDIIKLIVFFAPLITGLLSNYAIFLMALICIIGIGISINRKHKIILPKGKELILISMYASSFLFIECIAVDKGMNILGFLRAISIILFMLLILQNDNITNMKREILEVIPYSSIMSLVISGILVVLNNSEIIIDNRLNGTFFYANSYALFLLVGVYITLTKNKIKLIDYLITFVLCFGILLTNSRAIIILTIVTITFLAFIKIRKNPKEVFKIILVFIVLTCIYCNTNFGNRLTQKLFSSSEFQMRLVYYEDAIEMIKDNPFGLGYNGYYYKQVETQTAPYYTKSVHNVMLQLFLDVGIIPSLCVITFIILGTINKKQSIENLGLILIIMIHSMIDINFEYGYFWILIILLLEIEKRTIKINKVKSSYVGLCLLGGTYLIFLISSVGAELKNYRFAYTVVPFNTEALIQELYIADNWEKQLELANRIYKQNKNVTAVYQVLSANEQRKDNYLKAIEYEKSKLKLNRLSNEAYYDYFKYLEKMFDYYNQKKDYQNINLTLDEILNIKEMMDDINQTVNPSYVPTLYLNDEMIKVYEAINSLKNSS